MMVLTYLGAVSLLAGSTFLFIASIGLVRLPDLYSRMHAAAKPQWLGVFLIAVGLALSMRTPQWVAVAILMVILQTVSAPIGAHLMARAAYRTEQADFDCLVVDELAQDITQRTEPRPDQQPEETPHDQQGTTETRGRTKHPQSRS
ncbi:MAG: monovalent cation/H(+) antiporter subunit G [Actinomycetaceae bacterium]|nr:monovalent cation/H(+) antiporter subunit G [Actinomycetaceae bacterium]